MSQKNTTKLNIHAFKSGPDKDPDMVERSWAKLSAAMNSIFGESAGDLSFEELYRTGYNMVLHKHGEKLYESVEGLLNSRTKDICVEIKSANEATFLEEVKSKWLAHKRSLKMVRDILMYMDRTYVKQTPKMPVYDKGVNLFCRNCIQEPHVKKRLSDLLLELVEKERKGEKVDRDVIKNSTQMLMEMGKEVFHEDFEKPFLETSKQFYKIESESFLQENSCSDYLKKVEDRLLEEQDRVNSCLSMDYNAGDHGSGEQGGIKQVIEHELIGRHMQALIEKENSGLVYLLEHNKVDELKRMYDLFSRITKAPEVGLLPGLELLENKMAEHVVCRGKSIVVMPVDASGECKVDHIKFVKDLLDLKDQYDAIIKDAFKNEKSFINKLNKSFELFINQNARSPEFISLAMDHHLRGGGKKQGSGAHSEEEVEIQLEKCLQLFRYISEKDVFERYYKQHLSKRLLSDRSQSADMEQKVIQMLKTECGYQFTVKLEGMFKDINTSKTVREQFSSHLQQSADRSELTIDLQVKVLTTGYWPTQKAVQCQLPPDVDKVCNVFKRFYLAQHNGRQLTWQVNSGTAEVNSRYDRKYIITMPTFQMVALLLFADPSTTTLSFKDIENATKIPETDLKRTLQSLACGQFRLLNKDPKSKDIKDTDSFSFNANFSHKLIKFKVSSIASAKETNEEVQASRNKINEDRNPQIDAAIVRVMKTRRIMEHNLLIAEVTKQLQSRFVPEPLVIKKRIEGLIDRDFLQRQKGNMKAYEYLA